MNLAAYNVKYKLFPVETESRFVRESYMEQGIASFHRYKISFSRLIVESCFQITVCANNVRFIGIPHREKEL